MTSMAGATHRGRVIGRSALSARVTQLTLKLEGDEPFRWLAGQHVTLRPELDGDASAFSLAAAPTQSGLDVLTLALANSAELLAKAPLGALVLIDGPFGSLTWRDAPGALLVGAGTGIAPLRAIVHGALADGVSVPLVLIAGNRTEGDLLWHDELVALASEHANFRYEPVVSQRGPSWGGRAGYVQDHLAALAATLPAGHRAYLCGRTRMVEECRSLLGGLGVEGARILSEADA
jgi:NAD(P)H-flavin reductase